jgi:hypothetical protein
MARTRGAGLAAVVLMLGTPAVATAAAATSPFAPGIPASPAPVQTTTSTPPVVLSTPGSSSSGGLSSADAFAIGVGAIAVLGGICFFIWRDARRRAPIRHHAPVGANAGRGGAQKAKPKTRKLSPAERRRRKRGRAR